MISFVDELCHFAKFADIFKDYMSQETSALSYLLYKLIIDKGVQDTYQCCDRAKNVFSFDGNQL